MRHTSRIVKCVDCGREFPRKELNRKFRCHDCRIKIIREVVQQLHDHSGPYYDKWKESMQAATRRL